MGLGPAVQGQVLYTVSGSDRPKALQFGLTLKVGGRF
jgi:hypothetical protein